LLILLFSGVWMYFPEQVESSVSVFSKVAAAPEMLHSTPPQPGQAALSAGQALAVAERIFPDGEVRLVSLPKGETGVYKIYKRADDEVAQDYSNRWLAVDQYSGAVLYQTNRARRTAGDVFIEWLYPLHSGEAFGLGGRLVVCAVGVVPSVLFATGLIRWLQKRRAKRLRLAA
jgi:hypothetical protein